MIRFLILLFILPTVLQASKFVEIKPVTENIIALNFSDGFIDHAKLGEIPWETGTSHNIMLDTISAKKCISYLISSNTDKNYLNGRHPLNVGRKSKGIDFLDKETNDGKYNYKILGHWIYLVLPQKLTKGLEYKITLNGLAENTNVVNFVFDDVNNQSETIHVNQVGYSSNSGLKYAYVYQWLGDLGGLLIENPNEKNFYLFDVKKGHSVFEGKLELRKKFTKHQLSESYIDNDFCNSEVYQCNFSNFNIPGEYNIVVEGIGCSYPFHIGENGYWDAYYTTMRGLFHHRSGIDRTVEFSKWVKPVEHKPGVNGFEISYSNVKIMDGVNNFQGLVSQATGEVFPTKKGDWMPVDNNDWGWGGYFDAGDYDRKVSHLNASEYLLYAYELATDNFQDGDLNIPESGNGIPDIIDEAKWGIDCFRRLQGPTGGICGGMEENEHPIPGENSLTDSRPWYVYAEEADASFRLSAAAAQLAWCLEKAGTNAESDSLIKQAERVYEWAKKSKDKEKCKESWLRASSWLYKYTGKTTYLNDFVALYKLGTRDDFALFTMALLNPKKISKKIVLEIKSNFISEADQLYYSGNEHEVRLINGQPSGWNTVNYLINVHKLIYAYHLTGNSKYRDFIYTTCDYNLGGNPENRVFVTGLGEKSVNEVFNTDSWFDDIAESIPGIVPYGFPISFMQDDSTSVWRPYQTFNSCYPDYKNWPTGELWFENRYLINCNEYTIEETLGPAAGAYAYVAGRAKNLPKLDEVQGNKTGQKRFQDSIQMNKKAFSLKKANTDPENQ